MPEPTLQEFTELATRIADAEIPAPLLRELNGGIVVHPGTIRDRGYFVMGHYIQDGRGRSIALYYGSFRAVLDGEDATAWEAELRETLLHELRHHVEALAGVDDLGEEEEAAIARETAGRPLRRPRW